MTNTLEERDWDLLCTGFGIANVHRSWEQAHATERCRLALTLHEPGTEDGYPLQDSGDLARAPSSWP